MPSPAPPFACPGTLDEALYCEPYRLTRNSHQGNRKGRVSLA